MPWFNIFLNKKVILAFVLVSFVATTWYVFTDRGKTIVEQKEKIKQLEVNQTFNTIDYAVEVENAVTATNAKNRDDKIEEMKKEIADEKYDDANSNYDESIFNGMYFYKAHLP